MTNCESSFLITETVVNRVEVEYPLTLDGRSKAYEMLNEKYGPCGYKVKSSGPKSNAIGSVVVETFQNNLASELSQLLRRHEASIGAYTDDDGDSHFMLWSGDGNDLRLNGDSLSASSVWDSEDQQ